MVIPHDATEEQIRTAFPEDADQIIAFQCWLKLVGRAPNPKSPGSFRLTMPEDSGVRHACLEYAYGRMDGTQFLAELRRLKDLDTQSEKQVEIPN